MRPLFIFLLVLPLSLPLAASGLDTLRAQLRRAPGAERLHAAVELQSWNRKGDDKHPAISQGKASLQAETGPQGLMILWGKNVVQRAMKEVATQSQNPESPTPTREAMASLDPLALQDYFEAAPKLLLELEQAILQEEHPSTLDGRPCTLLTLKLEPRMSERDRKYVKALTATAKVWVDGDGLPLAADARVKLHGKALLVISFSTEEHEVFRFGRVQGHLVTVHHERETSGSGAGETGQTRRVVDLVYH